MPWDAVEALAAVVGVALTVATGFAIATSRWVQTRVASRRMMRQLSEQDFRRELIDVTLRSFIEPDTSKADPDGSEAAQDSGTLFRVLSQALYHAPPPQYLILLADSGMGKTSSLLAYCAHNLRPTLRRKYPIVLLYLGREGVEERIQKVGDKRNKILFLDALDEDPRAIADHRARVAELVKEAQEFRAVVLSCRSQFFHRDEEITVDTGIPVAGPRRPGDEGVHKLRRIYLKPFDEERIRIFLRRHYGILRRKARRRAAAVLDRIGDLSARPMLLTYVDDLELMRSGGDISLREAYQQLISAWLLREKWFVGDTDALRSFCTRLAVEVYLRRRERGGEIVPIDEIRPLADEWGIALESWKLHGRSLLNRDHAGNFKFAHRSIMEFLFVEAFFAGANECLSDIWTDQMRAFALEHSSLVGAGRPALTGQWLRATLTGYLSTPPEMFASALRDYLSSHSPLRPRAAELEVEPVAAGDAGDSLVLLPNRMLLSLAGHSVQIKPLLPGDRETILDRLREISIPRA